MMEDERKLRKPLSSASAIMHRHDKKHKKWFRNLLHGDTSSKHSQKEEHARGRVYGDMSDRAVSKSLENVGQLSLRLFGLPSKRASSESYLNGDDDNQSVTSASSCDSDSANFFLGEPSPAQSGGPLNQHNVTPLPSACSSDNDLSETESVNLAPAQGTISEPDQSGDSYFPNWFSYLPFSVGYNLSSSTDSLNSQSEERCALTHLLTMSDSDQESSGPSNRHVLMQHPFHQLEVCLQEGKDLVIRDSCGTSDPYVKFKCGNKQLYKSRTVHKNLNPRWDERFVVSVEDVFKPILVKVYDYDRGTSDDSMGSAELLLENIPPNEPTDVELRLAEKGKEEYMGVVRLQVTLIPKSHEDREQYFRKTVKMTEKESMARKLKMQMWTNVVTVILVEGRDLIPMDDNGLSDPYVKFKLGNEKYKSKHKYKTLCPRWLEQFDLRMYQGQTSHLEMIVYDHDVGRDDFMGRAVIDLSRLERELTHMVEQPLEDGAGMLKLLITISGTCADESISDLTAYSFNPLERMEVIQRYGVMKSFKNFRDVGWLQVKVYKAQDLMSADLGGKSDPFCVLELVNTRLQTHTEYKTLNPEWNKIFTFHVKDIHSVLEMTIYDEDRDKKVEFLGRVAIPLLRIRPGEKRWYALKDKKLIHRTKGSILLELDFIYNHIKAAVRTVNPKEEKYMQPEPKFKISVMKRNIDRVTSIISTFIDTGKFVNSCFNWDSPVRSITAFIVFLVMVWNFESYMLPLTLLVLLLKNVLLTSIVTTYSRDPDIAAYEDDDDDFDGEDDAEKEEKKSFKEKLQAAQEICLQVQEGLDVVASLGERVKNTFTWSVPWLTSLAVIALSLGVIILYFVPIRYLILAWGINKFTKKLRAPNAIPNNEVLDFLSRIPSDRELIEYKELRPDINTIPGRKKTR
ncbi:multiple C2 and transmembrane domain-containing protein 1-like isoform X1 [Mya arenaria]|uniref:multiple C2 and transmembrane domain-containing protein 1-like isoform X1 n=2 Tax=Mya arenaria TaxID=6604 RepID=UPI0022E23F62|nr:multiple C2 and transmembrane domain-containing protein 1-like isoform X1 [Mya arenaria]